MVQKVRYCMYVLFVYWLCRIVCTVAMSRLSFCWQTQHQSAVQHLSFAMIFRWRRPVLAVAMVLQRRRLMPWMCCSLIKPWFTVIASATHTRPITVSVCTASFVFCQETWSSFVTDPLAVNRQVHVHSQQVKIEDIYTKTETETVVMLVITGSKMWYDIISYVEIHPAFRSQRSLTHMTAK